MQQCDCITINNHGLSKKISEKYPWAEKSSLESQSSYTGGQRSAWNNKNNGITRLYNIPDVICILAQWDFGRGNIRQIEPYKDS